MTQRNLLIVVALVGGLAIAVIVGLQLDERPQSAAGPSNVPRASASASGLPNISPSAATASAASTSAAAGSVVNDRFGFVTMATGPAFNIVSETGPFAASGFSGQAAAASPTGDRVAYLQYSEGTVRLRVRTVADGIERVVVALTGENATGLAWSNDGTGLLLSVGTAADTGPASTTPATLRTVDVASGAMQVIAQRTDGKIYKPLAWDRPGKLAAAADTGPGGFDTAYVTVDLAPTPARATSAAVTGRVSMQASADAKFVSSADLDNGDVRWWPLARYAAAATVGKATQARPVWRPGTSQVGWVENGELRLFDAVGGGAATAVRGLGSNVRLATFRADGSAAVLATQVTPTAGGTTFSIVDLGSGARDDLNVTGNIVFSVRLR